MYEVDQIVVIIRPTLKMLEWLNQQPGQTEILSLEDLRSDCTALLIPIFNSPEEAQYYIDQNYTDIFESELQSWSIDQQNWPKNRTLDMFQAWFEIDFHSMVYVMSDRSENELDFEESESPSLLQ